MSEVFQRLLLNNQTSVPLRGGLAVPLPWNQVGALAEGTGLLDHTASMHDAWDGYKASLPATLGLAGAAAIEGRIAQAEGLRKARAYSDFLNKNPDVVRAQSENYLSNRFGSAKVPAFYREMEDLQMAARQNPPPFARSGIVEQTGKVAGGLARGLGAGFLSNAGLEATASSFETPTEEYAARMGMEAGRSLPRDVGIRVLGTLQDLGNAIMLRDREYRSVMEGFVPDKSVRKHGGGGASGEW